MLFKRCFAAAFFAGVAMAIQTAKAESGFYGDLRAGLAEMETMRFSDPATANLTVDPKGWMGTDRCGRLSLRRTGPDRVVGRLSAHQDRRRL